MEPAGARLFWLEPESNFPNLDFLLYIPYKASEDADEKFWAESRSRSKLDLLSNAAINKFKLKYCLSERPNWSQYFYFIKVIILEKQFSNVVEIT